MDVFSIGHTAEGRQILAAKVTVAAIRDSDNNKCKLQEKAPRLATG